MHQIFEEIKPEVSNKFSYYKPKFEKRNKSLELHVDRGLKIENYSNLVYSPRKDYIWPNLRSI